MPRTKLLGDPIRDFRTHQPARAQSGMLLLGAVVDAFAVAILSWPLIRQMGSSVADPRQLSVAGGVWGRADLDLLIWILSWTAHALTTHPLDLFQANLFFPARDTLALSENLLGLAPIATPIFWLTGNPVLTYNVTVLIVVWLTALCTFALVRAWTGSATAAFLAGAAFAFGSHVVGSWIRLHCSAVHFFPLVILLGWRAARTPQIGTLAALASATALQLLAGIYVAFELLALLAAFAPALVVEARRSGHRGLAPLCSIAAGALALVAVGPAYLRVRASGTLPDLPEAMARVASMSHTPGIVVGWIVADLGWPVVALSVIGLVAARRVDWHIRAGMLIVAVFGGVLSCGMASPLIPGMELPSAYEVLMRIVPGFSGMRSPSRFIVLPLLGISVLAGLGAGSLVELARDRLGQRTATLASAMIGLLAVIRIVSEIPHGGLPMVPVRLGGVAHAVHTWLRDRAEPGPVVELPVANSAIDGPALLATGRAMVGSTLHFMPLLSGYSGHRPANSALILTLAQRLPDSAAFTALCAVAPPRWIAVHLGLIENGDAAWTAAERRLGLTPAARFGRDVVYRADTACASLADPRLATAVGANERRGQTFAGNPLIALDATKVSGSLRGEVPKAMEAGSFRWLWLDVRNDGDEILPGLAGTVDGAIEVQARWRTLENAVVANGEPLPLGADLATAEVVRAQVPVVAPRQPGSYVLEIGLAQRGRGWFADTAANRFIVRRQVEILAPE